MKTKPRFNLNLNLPKHLIRICAAVGVLLAGQSQTPSFGRAPEKANATNPILFVTQVPVPADFTTIGAVFGNHKASLQDVSRGGDLWIRYPDGTLRNLTKEAGYGDDGQQGANAIAVRDPSVYWDGSKAIFSMVVGAPTQRYQLNTYYWQLYEISGLGIGQTAVITKVANQPANFNNISPIYGTDDRIIFTTDRPRNGAAHLYPQLDEYEEAPTVSGLWSLDPKTGDLFQLDHAPSGDFTPILDSFGRVIFTRWDHLQRDQQADGDTTNTNCSNGSVYGTFNYSDESASATYNLQNPDRTEVFPEPRSCRNDLLTGTNLNGHSFNQFFPWMVNEDGTEHETINHIGRHEFHSYFDVSFNDDPNLTYHSSESRPINPNTVENLLQIKEDPTHPGDYYAIDAPEFGTHASGQVISITAAPSANPDSTIVSYVTHRDTSSFTDTPSPNHSGLYRDPLPLADGTLIAAHTFSTQQEQNIGSTDHPQSRYAYRIKQLGKTDAYWTPTFTLTNGISETVTWWDPDTLITYSGNLWELQPIEVRARPRPPRLGSQVPGPEVQAFTQANVDMAQFQAWLRQNNLALSVSRNVTTRDHSDVQQPFNLRVPGGVQTLGASGKIYDVQYMQYFQADQLRGLTGCCSNTPRDGRRVIAQVMHDNTAIAANPVITGPAGSVLIAADGSQAAIVPARRALTWQMTDGNGAGVVRERYWLTFQPGEVRVCTSCHGINSTDQANHPKPNNSPQALVALLQQWKTKYGNDPVTPMPPTSTPIPSTTPLPTRTPDPRLDKHVHLPVMMR